MILVFRAIPGAAPWSEPHRDYQTIAGVCCETEESGRRIAAANSIEERPDAWLTPGFVRVEMWAETATVDYEQLIFSDAM